VYNKLTAEIIRRASGRPRLGILLGTAGLLVAVSRETHRGAALDLPVPLVDCQAAHLAASRLVAVED